MPQIKDQTEIEDFHVIKKITLSTTIRAASIDEAEVTARATEDAMWEKDKENIEVIRLPF